MKSRDILTIVHQYWILFLLTNEHFVKHYSFVLMDHCCAYCNLNFKESKTHAFKNVSEIIKLLISISWIQLLVMHGSIRRMPFLTM